MLTNLKCGLGGLICLFLATASPLPAAVTKAPDAEERVGKAAGDITYVLYYREDPKGPWYEWTVYTTLADAEAQAKKLRDAGGVETKILTRPSH